MRGMWEPCVVPLILFILTINIVAGQQKLENPVCNHWPDRGPCIEFTIKWYYDSYDHRCRRFYYGGCDGNANRFDSLEECSSQCKFEEPSNRDRCFQPHDPGHCNADIERWFFHPIRKQCMCSWWSGCGGNSNIYYSYKHCTEICGEYAVAGPALDENYWGKRNTSTMSTASQNVFKHETDTSDIYSIQTDDITPVWVNISHYDDTPLRYMESPKEKMFLFRQNFPVRARQAKILRMVDDPIPLQDALSVPLRKRTHILKKKAPKMVHITNKVNPPTILETNTLEPRYTLDKKEGNDYVLKIDDSTTTTTQSPTTTTTADPAVLSQFQDYLQDHKLKLLRQLEAQFPDHDISLIPHVETVTYPDGRHIVRQRIQWTARPRNSNNNRQYEIPSVPSNPIPTEYSTTVAPMPVMTPVKPLTEVLTTVEPTPSDYEIRQQRQKEKHRLAMEEQRKRQEEYQKIQEERMRQWEEQQRKFKEEKQKKAREAEEAARRHREAIEKSRREHEEARRKFEADRLAQMRTTRPPIYYDQSTDRHIVPTVTHPTVYTPYSEVPVQRPIYDATRAPYYRPETRPTQAAVTAEPINFYRPLVTTVTPDSLSLEDIIAIDESKNYEDDYDVPAVLPPHPKTTSAPKRPVYAPPPPPPPRQRNNDPRLSPIVFPANKKSNLDDEYVQNLDFGDYMS